jgi:hypothetical protein
MTNQKIRLLRQSFFWFLYYLIAHGRANFCERKGVHQYQPVLSFAPYGQNFITKLRINRYDEQNFNSRLAKVV